MTHKLIQFSILLILTSSIFTSCGEDTSASEKSDKSETKEDNIIAVTGKITGAEGKTLTITRAISPTQTQALDSVVLGADGAFEFKVNEPFISFYTLQLPRKMPLSLFIEMDDTPSVVTDLESFPKAKITGSKHNSYIDEYLSAMIDFQTKRSKLLQQSKELPFGEKEKRQAILDTIQEISSSLKGIAKKTVEAHPESPAMLLALVHFFPQSSLSDYDTTQLDIVRKVRDEMGKKYKSTLFYNQVNKDLAMVETQLKKMNRPKDMAPEISLPTPDGDILSLSSLRGKIVLVDFWASWCGPCRRENPNVVKLYNKYKDQGFTVYSVSLDGVPRQQGDPKQSWLTAIQQDGLVWPNHVSDLKGWESGVIQDYGFSGIPYTVLLDREGKIIGERLRGQGLEQKLKELFEK